MVQQVAVSPESAAMQRSLLCVAAGFLLVRDADSLLGVPKSKHALYEGSSFACDDGATLIPAEQVNDDYCDCDDGTDEPGTAACSGRGGQFYCVNKLFRGRWIPSSRVGDGVCDCCDASDEPEGLCSNNCEEVGATYRAELQEQIRRQQEGGEIKQGYIAKGTEAMSAVQQEIEAKKAKVAEYEGIVEVAKAAVKVLEEAERSREDELKNDLEAQRIKALRLDELDAGALRALVVDLAETLAEQAADAHSEAKGFAEQVEKDFTDVKKELEDCDEKLDAKQGDGDSGADTAEDKEKKPSVLKKASKKRGKRHFTSQFTAKGLANKELPSTTNILVDMLAERLPAQQVEVAAAEEAVDMEIGSDSEAQLSEAEDDGGEHDYYSDGGDPEEEMDMDEADSYTNNGVSWIGGAGDAVLESPELKAKRTELSDAERELRDAKKSLKEGEDDIKADFGQDNEWWVLKGQCFEVKSDGYTYEMCPYGKAQQDGKVNLGKWEGWGEGGNVVMKFGGGTKCWNGPQRSLTVTAKCGTDNELHAVVEPSICTYTAEFSTPAACAFSNKPLNLDLGEPDEE